jgi:hypothetical protein
MFRKSFCPKSFSYPFNFSFKKSLISIDFIESKGEKQPALRSFGQFLFININIF